MKLVWMFFAPVDTWTLILPHILETWPAARYATSGSMKNVKISKTMSSPKLLTGSVQIAMYLLFTSSFRSGWFVLCSFNFRTSLSVRLCILTLLSTVMFCVCQLPFVAFKLRKSFQVYCYPAFVQ